MSNTIILKKSSTASSVPAAAALQPGELAINLADQRLYSKTTGGTVFVVGAPGTVTSVSGTGTVSGLTLTGTVTTSGSLTLGGSLTLTSGNVTTALGYTPPSRASFATGPNSSITAVDVRNITNPTTGLGYAGGARFRFSSLNDDNASPFADVIDLSTYTDNTGGGFNALYFGKNSHLLQHKYAAAGATAWTVRTVAYTDSNITGTAANVTGTVAVANGGTGATTAAAARTNLGATTVGGNLFTLANVAAISFPRINADNTVSALDAATFRTAIGAGTSSTTGTVTSVGGTGSVSGLTLSGTVTSSGNLTLGGTLSVTPSNFASQTANTFLAAPNGAAGVPTFRAIAAADIPTLNQNTTGTAANVTGTVAVANGGTGSTTAAGARTNLGAAASGANTDITSLAQSTSVAASGTIAADSIGFRGIPQNAQTAAYTLALADAGRHISITTGGITIPANSSVAFPVGTTIVIYNNSASNQNIAITTDTLRLAGTATTGTRNIAQRGLATLVKVAATEWVVSGSVT